MKRRSPRAVWSLQEELKKTIFGLRKLYHHGSRVPLRFIVGFSGGIDSSVLLHALHHFSNELQLDLIPAYVNHGLRPEATLEEEWAGEFCSLLGLKLEVHRCLKMGDSKNLEAWAREQRYGFFSRLYRIYDANWILTAHHQADQVETLLWRLFTGRIRGTLRGIQPVDLKNHLFRPFLQISRQQIQAYQRESGINFVHDRSNDLTSFTRNFLRHEAIPLLENLNPNLTTTLSEIARYGADDEAYLASESQKAANKVIDLPAASYLISLPKALRWRVLQVWAENQLGEVSNEIPSSSFDRILDVLGARDAGSILSPNLAERKLLVEEKQARKERTIELKKGIVCQLTEDGRLLFQFSGESKVVTKTVTNRQELLPIPGSLLWSVEGIVTELKADIIVHDSASYSVVKSLLDSGSGRSYPRDVEYFDVEELNCRELTVRQRVAGDQVNVWKRGHRLVKKLLQEKNVNSLFRLYVPMIVCGADILWIPGIARSNIAPVSEFSRRVLVLKARNIK